MADNRMLQAIADSIVEMRGEMNKGFKSVNKRIDDLDGKLTKRIDRLGLEKKFNAFCA